MQLTDEEMTQKLKREFRLRIPGGHHIAIAAVSASLTGHENDSDWIKEHFSKLIERVQVDAYRNYLKAESKAGKQAFEAVLLTLIGENASAKDVLNIMGNHFHALDRFFLGLTQGRRPRAGKTFEYLIKQLFIQLKYPFTPQPIIDGQPDFVIPSLEYFKKNPIDSIIFTVKRTLRERWRQIVTEGTRGLGFFLATIDEDVASRDLPEMVRSRIHLVVPERIKQGREDYKLAANVISFEYFFRYHLDPAMERWKASGVI